jgi:hypothetical protein
MSIPVLINPVGVIGSVSITMGYPKNYQEYIDWLWLEWFRSRLKNEKTNIICWRKSRKTFETASSLVGVGDELYRSSICEPSRWYAKGKNWAINTFSSKKVSRIFQPMENSG